jgi:hypothetical protein
MLAVAEFAASYQLGRPTQRVVTNQDVTPEQWLAALMDDDEDEAAAAAVFHSNGATG